MEPALDPGRGRQRHAPGPGLTRGMGLRITAGVRRSHLIPSPIFGYNSFPVQARNGLEKFEDALSPTEIETADKLAREWMEKHRE